MFDRILPVIRVKKLLLCILSLMLCLNTSVIHAKEPESLMIVAHPDDETIWGGSHLINGNYTVLCITNGNNKKRKKEFMNVTSTSCNIYTSIQKNIPLCCHNGYSL